MKRKLLRVLSWLFPWPFLFFLEEEFLKNQIRLVETRIMLIQMTLYSSAYKTALASYGNHKPDCPWHSIYAMSGETHHGVCSCGFEEFQHTAKALERSLEDTLNGNHSSSETESQQEGRKEEPQTGARQSEVRAVSETPDAGEAQDRANREEQRVA